MTDLSSPEMQSIFKKLQRTTIVTNVIMVAITLAAAGVAIWASTLGPRDSTDWAEIFFFILLGLIMAYLCFIIVWEFLLRIKNKRYLCTFISEGYRAVPELTAGGDAKFELLLVGDKLTVMREGCEKYVQYDLSPVKSFTGVCANIVRLSKLYLVDFYCAQDTEGKTLTGTSGVNSVTLCDKVRGKNKILVIKEDGKPRKTVNAESLKKWELNG